MNIDPDSGSGNHGHGGFSSG
ncbi:unnamed protein product, partial [Rotaria sp. Silwood1]